MLPPPDPPARPESGDTPARFEVSLIVYDPLILATWGLSRNGVKNYSKGPCVTILE